MFKAGEVPLAALRGWQGSGQGKPVSGLVPATSRAGDPGLGFSIMLVSYVPLPSSLKVCAEDLLDAQQHARALAS